MTARTHEREQWLADVLATAVEGGVNGWAQITDYQYADDAPGQARATFWFEPIDDKPVEVDKDGDTSIVVTIDVVARGMRVLREQRAADPSWAGSTSWKYVLESNRTNGEDGDYDADDASCIVQCGMFGDVVFG